MNRCYILLLLLCATVFAQVTTLRGVAVADPPFLFIDASIPTTNPKARYSGYAIDFTNELFRRMGANYSYVIYESAGGYSGSPLANGSWIGAIDDLIQGTADFFIGSLAINSVRNKAIDFTRDYLPNGLT
jgi:ABC-type amino acid transport substrate-binding protein